MTRPLFFRYGRFGLPAFIAVLAALPYLSRFVSINLVNHAYADSAEETFIPRAPAVDDTLEISGLQAHFQSIARKCSPTVVAISAAISKTDSDEALRDESMNADKLEILLDKGVRTVGTGFIIDSDGYILTNEHVVGESEQVWVTTDTGKVYPAVVVGSDPRLDLAVLKVPAKNLPTVKFAPFDSVQRGQWTIALGNPYGLAGSGEMAMSVGVVSATDRSLPKLASKENRIYSNLIQTTAQINPGNSGGPLFDINGEVIALNTAVILPQKQTNGIGFALPITPRFLEIISELKQGREVVHGYLGVMVVTPTTRERKVAGLQGEIGARVDSIEANSPAASCGLQLDDILVCLNNTEVRSGDHFVRLIGDVKVGTPSKMRVYREGKPVEISVTPSKRPMPSTIVYRENQRLRWRGLLLGPVPANWEADAKTKKAPTGLIVLAIDPGSPLLKQGVHQGSVITMVAGKPVPSIVDLQQIINDNPPESCGVECFKASDVVASTGQ